MRSRDRSAPAPPHGDVAVERVTFLLGAALVLLLPLVWSSESLEAFRGPKRELALALWATLAAVFLTGAFRGAAWRDPWWAAWAGVVAGAVLSAPASGHPGVVLVRTLPVLLAALGWGALRRLSESGRRRLATLLVAAGTLQAAVTALLVLPAFQPEAFGRIYEFEGRYKWIGTLGNPADVAVFLVLPALLAAALALTRRRRRWAPAAAAALMLAVVIATRTLSAVIAFGCGGAVLLWRYVPRRFRAAAVAAAIAVAIAAGMVGPLAPRVRAAVQEFKRGGWTAIGSGRGAGYAAALGMIAARPVLGVGFGRFESNSFAYQDEALLAGRARVLRLETAFGQAHNEVLQHAAETGLLGLALAAAGIAWAARRGRSAPTPLPARLPMLAAMAAIALLQFPLHLAAIAAQWAVFAALALPPLPAAPPPAVRRRLVNWLAVAAIAVAASFTAWQRHRGSVAWQEASTLVEVMRQGQVRQGRAEAARVALERIESRLRWFPGAWDARVVAGNVAMLAGRREAALAHFEAALRLAERPETRFNVGMALLALGDQEAGYAHLIRAVKLNPRVVAQVTDPEVAASLRRRLDADGYGARYPWIYKAPPSSRR